MLSSTSGSDPGPRHLAVHVVTTADRTVVRLVGAADVSSWDALDRQLASADLGPAVGVELDLESLTFSDVASVLRCADFAADVIGSGRSFATRGATPLVRRVAEILGVKDRLAFA
ncbi:STAS domain-containing protein [Phycicoccus avicenniae]|uniref:STAS domain-containing protein n=1 Tax=Phycicoccus avicenniae TaxID=2828860 RepID=UPI003D26631C